MGTDYLTETAEESSPSWVRQMNPASALISCIAKDHGTSEDGKQMTEPDAK